MVKRRSDEYNDKSCWVIIIHERPWNTLQTNIKLKVSCIKTKEQVSLCDNRPLINISDLRCFELWSVSARWTEATFTVAVIIIILLHHKLYNDNQNYTSHSVSQRDYNNVCKQAINNKRHRRRLDNDKDRQKGIRQQGRDFVNWNLYRRGRGTV